MVSPSNGTTLHIGDWLISDLEAYKNKQPDYGDLVVYSSFDGQLYTNRIVGLPNESIDIIDNVVNVNGNTKKAIFIKDTLSTQRKI
jgi:signal peptidase I